MSRAVAIDTLNDSVLNTFGQTATVFVPGVGTDLSVVFEAPYSAGQSPTEHAFQRPDYQMTCRSDEFEETGAKAGDTVTVAGQTYFIADILQNDGCTRSALFVVADTGNQRVRRSGPDPVGAEDSGRNPEIVLSCLVSAVWSCRRLPVSSASSAVRQVGAATIRHEGMVFASGRRLVKSCGRILFLLGEQRPLVPGRYQLTLKGSAESRTQLIRIR